MTKDSLQDLYVDELKDMYNAETQLVKALPKMAKASFLGSTAASIRGAPATNQGPGGASEGGV